MKKTCESCKYYARYKSQDIVNPDKTVTKGKIEQQQCQRNKPYFELTDLHPCALYEKGETGYPARLPIHPRKSK